MCGGMLKKRKICGNYEQCKLLNRDSPGSRTSQVRIWDAKSWTRGAAVLNPSKLRSLGRIVRFVRTWLAPIADPVHAIRGVVLYPRFFLDWRRYAQLPGAEPARLTQAYPQIHDRTRATGIDSQYFFANGWAARRILATSPGFHVDVGSDAMFANLLGAVVPLCFVDYRPVHARLAGFECVAGSLLCLPFAARSIPSLSCLHVVEHVGLGRYGDPLDPKGTLKAVGDLVRVLAPGGNLFLAAPVGRPSLWFNAHRVHPVEAILKMVGYLQLVEFSGVHDDGRFVEHVRPFEFCESACACGLFWFRRPG